MMRRLHCTVTYRIQAVAKEFKVDGAESIVYNKTDTHKCQNRLGARTFKFSIDDSSLNRVSRWLLKLLSRITYLH